MIDSPYKNTTWEFLMTPVIMLVAVLVKFIVWTAPVGYEIMFSIRALSEEELSEYEDDWDDYS
jgi:cytochrome c oxidase assembly factor CtaG